MAGVRVTHGQVPSFPVYLFDIDGTLLDSAEDICGAIQQVLVAHGSLPRDFEYLKSFVGLHLNECFRDALPHFTDEISADLIAQYRALYLGAGHAKTRVFPGVREGLAALGGRKSTATTKGSVTTRAVLEQFDLLRHFDHVQGTDGFPCKPAPDVIHTALAALGAKPEDCLMVGDSAPDMQAGRRAGVKICAVRYGYGDPEELARFEPDYWVDDLRELSGQPVLPAACPAGITR
jgi:HAD superfamily hydrolase (TIGR01509 family)